MKIVKPLILGSALCVTMSTLIVAGCETTPTRASAELDVDENGNVILKGGIYWEWGNDPQPADGDSDNRLLDPPSDPPAGLQHLGTAIEGKVFVDVFSDPNTGAQWIQDSNGDYRLVYFGAYTMGSDGVAIQDAGSLNINPANIFSYSSEIDFSFDEAMDTAMLAFVFPEELTDDYMQAIDMPFLVQENLIVLPNGDYHLTYTGSINDVLGAAWSLGVLEITFKNPLAGFVNVILSGSSNLVTINTSIESRTMVLEFTAPDNLP